MDFKTYKTKALQLERRDFKTTKQTLKDDNKLRMLHAAMGISTEAGEILDQFKKHIYYGKELDVLNIIEEIGDQYWYINVLLDTLGVDIEEVLQKNIDKLYARYKGGKFTEKDAINRNLKKERKKLEK